MLLMKEKVKAGILGLCTADALGVPVEFSSRLELKTRPVSGMQGFGTHCQPPGTWSDDSSMALALLDSLCSGLDYEDIMARFRLFLHQGSYTPYGKVFDVGMTCSDAINRSTNLPATRCGGTQESDNGNGSLMRILPLAFYLYAHYGEDFWREKAAIETIHNVSSLTHGHPRSLISCGIYLSIAVLLDRLPPAEAVHVGAARAWDWYAVQEGFALELAHFAWLQDAAFAFLPEEEIRSSGYVVDTLEAALWCLLNADSYKSCVLAAVNLGGDTDTVAAVAGGLAGIAYGLRAIPREWLGTLARADYINSLCTAFADTL